MTVDIEVFEGDTHAIIGPNRRRQDDPDQPLPASCFPTGPRGFRRQDITRCRPGARVAADSRSSFSRSPSSTRFITALENVMLACRRTIPLTPSRSSCFFSAFWRPARQEASAGSAPNRDPSALAWSGAAGVPGREPGALPSQRALEVATALAPRPRLLLRANRSPDMGVYETSAA